VIVVLLTTVTDDAGCVPNFTVAPGTKPVPVIVTCVPPNLHPVDGETDVIVGAGPGVNVGVRVGVCVGVTVGVRVGVRVGVDVRVSVGVTVGVAVRVGVPVRVGVLVGVLVGVTVGVRVGVGVGVAVAAPTGVQVGVAVGVRVGVPVGVTVGVGVGGQPPDAVMVTGKDEVNVPVCPIGQQVTGTLCAPVVVAQLAVTWVETVPSATESVVGNVMLASLPITR